MSQNIQPRKKSSNIITCIHLLYTTTMSNYVQCNILNAYYVHYYFFYVTPFFF